TAAGLAAEAREKLKPMVVKLLDDAERSGGYIEPFKPVIRSLARSFGKAAGEEDEDDVFASPKDEAEKAAFLRAVCDSTASLFSLAEMVINESLVKSEYFAPFYEKLIRDSEGIPPQESDADFVDRLRLRDSWSLDEIEESLDHERPAKSSPFGQDPN